jgi:hypothetical protein
LVKGAVMNNSPENNLVTLQTQKEITSLYKNFLEILENIKQQHETMLRKASVNVDENYLKDINYFTKEYHDYIRKKILDEGNDTSRTLLTFLDYFDFQINPQKLQQATEKQKIIKRVVISNPIEYNK